MKIRANGGHLVQMRDKSWWFEFDEVTRVRLASRLHINVPLRVPVTKLACGPTPIMATLGGFYHDGKYCAPADFSQEWNYAYWGW